MGSDRSYLRDFDKRYLMSEYSTNMINLLLHVSLYATASANSFLPSSDDVGNAGGHVQVFTISADLQASW